MKKIATILSVRNFEEKACILLATRQGVVKKTELSAFSNPRRKGVYAINIDEGDEVIAARLTSENDRSCSFTKTAWLCASTKGLCDSWEESPVASKGVTLRDAEDDRRRLRSRQRRRDELSSFAKTAMENARSSTISARRTGAASASVRSSPVNAMACGRRTLRH